MAIYSDLQKDEYRGMIRNIIYKYFRFVDICIKVTIIILVSIFDYKFEEILSQQDRYLYGIRPIIHVLVIGKQFHYDPWIINETMSILVAKIYR